MIFFESIRIEKVGLTLSLQKKNFALWSFSSQNIRTTIVSHRAEIIHSVNDLEFT